MKLLVTGGAGFIGSNFNRYVLKQHPNNQITNFDALTYAGNLENLADIADSPSYIFVKGDIADPQDVAGVFQEKYDAIIHFAAESHVDRSLEDAAPFLHTNVLGTQVLLDAVRRRGISRFVHIGTDEVYGSAPPGGRFDENAPLAPSSPYAASKAAADMLVLSYIHSYGFPALILRCTNNYGPYQFPEKLIPLMIANAMEDKPLPVYGDGLQERDWLYVEDHCRAIYLALTKGRIGEIYNISADAPQTNLNVIRTLLKLLGKPESLITTVADRPGHDRRYALNSQKLRSELDWKPKHPFEEGLKKTVEWYQSNTEWLERCRRGDYRDYYRRHYEERAATLGSTHGPKG